MPGDESTPPRGTADIVAAVVRPRKQRHAEPESTATPRIRTGLHDGLADWSHTTGPGVGFSARTTRRLYWLGVLIGGAVEMPCAGRRW